MSCLPKSSILKEKSKINSLKTLKILEFEPHKRAKSVRRNAKIEIKFNSQLDPSTISTNTENNTCSGTIQITSDNFRTCVIMKKLDLVNENKNILLTPKEVYTSNTLHKILLKKGIKGENGFSLKKDIINSQGFRTTWSHQFGTSGNDSGIAISVDRNDNIYITGLTSEGKNSEKKDLFLTKFLQNGYQRWIIQPGFGRAVSAASLKINNNKKILLSAYSNNKNNAAVIIGNFSFEGETISTKTILLSGKSRGNGITIDNEGNTYVTDASPFDVLKIDVKGRKLWGSELNQRVRIGALAADTENSLYITGRINHLLDDKFTKVDSDILLLKISQMGPKLWSRTYESPQNESTNGIAIKSNKAVAIVGYISQSGYPKDIKKGNKDAFVAKYNTEGKLNWSHIFKGNKFEECTVSLWTSEGDLLVGGYTESSLGDKTNIGKEDSFLAKFSNNGELQWLKQFGSEENERPLGLALGSRGQIYVTGYSEGQIDGAKYNGGRDVFLVKFDKNGIKQ